MHVWVGACGADNAQRLYERHGFRREVARDRMRGDGVRMLAYLHDRCGG